MDDDETIIMDILICNGCGDCWYWYNHGGAYRGRSPGLDSIQWGCVVCGDFHPFALRRYRVDAVTVKWLRANGYGEWDNVKSVLEHMAEPA